MLALLALLLFRSAYTVVDVPHNSLLMFISKDSQDRNLIAGLRIFFSSLGRLSATALTAYMLQSWATTTLPERFLNAALVLSVAYVLSLALCAFSVRRTSLFSNSGRQQFAQLGTVVRRMVTGRGILTVFFLTAVNSVMTPVIAATIIYYSKYAFGNDSVGPVAVTLLTVAQGLSVPVWTWLVARIGHRTRTLITSYVAFACAVAFGTFAFSPVTICLTAILAGFSMGGMFMLNWSMLADTLDHSRVGSELTVFGLYTSVNKVLHGVAQAYLGFVLAVFGFEADSSLVSGSIDGIRTAVFAMPILGSLLCLVALRRYQLSADPDHVDT